MQPVGINQRMPFRGNDLDVLEPGGFQAFGHELRGALYVGRMLGQRADAGNTKKIL